MTEERYKQKLESINKEYEAAKKRLYIEYGLSKVTCKVGDIIKDHRWTFRVDKITVHKSFDFPEPVYTGIELKKDLTPRKDGNVVSIYGNNFEIVKQS